MTTNYERIKSMSIEEMAEFISCILNCDNLVCSKCLIKGLCGDAYTPYHTEQWLQQKAE